MPSRIRDPETGRFVAAEKQNGAGDTERIGPLTMAVQSSELLERLRFGQRGGYQYGTDRNIYKVAGYVAQGKLTFSDYWAKYDRQDVAGRIVDMPAQTTWRNPPEIHERDADGEAIKEDTPWSKAAREMVERLKLWRRCEQVDRLSRIGRFGVLVIGEKGVPDSAMVRPMGKLSGPEDVIYLRAFHEGSVVIEKWIMDAGNPLFGMPEIYRIELASGMENFPAMTTQVHHTRVIHVAEDRLEDEVYGRPALKRVMNLFNDMQKITAATAEGFWQIADRLLMVSIDPNAKVGDDQRQALSQAIQEMFHDLRRHLVAQGLEAEWLGGSTPDPMGAAQLYMMLIGAAAGIPFRVLFGNDTGERSSQEDQKQWLGTVGERIERHASPNILQEFFDRMIAHGALKAPANGYTDVWPSLYETPEKELAETDKAVAETAKALTPVGGDPTALVEITEEGRVKLIPLAADETPFKIPERVPGGDPFDEPPGSDEGEEEDDGGDDDPEEMEEAA